MLCRIRKPFDTDEWPGWIPDMDYLDGKIINVYDYKITHLSGDDLRYIVIDDFTINFNWLELRKPIRIEKNIKG